jgi:TetR/AcrR family transcriptional regulator
MIYYYFGTKDDLFLAVVEEVYGNILRDFEVALAEDLPPATRLRRLYDRVGELSDVEVQTVRLVLEDALRTPRRMMRLIERFKEGHVPLVLAMVRDGMVDGTFDRRHNPLLIVFTLISVGAVPQMLLRAIGEPLGITAATLQEAPLSETLVDIALGGVGGSNARGASAQERSEK